jgi:DNA methyltransferase 1-associated protein 1
VTACRDDGLELRHWVKGYKDANGRIRDAQEGDYAFAKYNKKVRAATAVQQ